MQTSGIYILTYGNKVVYVGQSNDLDRRLEQHFYDKHFDGVATKTVPLEDLDKVEKETILKYRPHLNKQFMTASPYTKERIEQSTWDNLMEEIEADDFDWEVWDVTPDTLSIVVGPYRVLRTESISSAIRKFDNLPDRVSEVFIGLLEECPDYILCGADYKYREALLAYLKVKVNK